MNTPSSSSMPSVMHSEKEANANDEVRELLCPPELKQLMAKLRYMGRQYAAGQTMRGGHMGKHYLEEAADELDRLFARTIELGQEVADLRNVVQAACIGGMPALAASWQKRFPDHPISISGRAREFTGEILGAGDREIGEGRAIEARTQDQAAKLEAFVSSKLRDANGEPARDLNARPAEGGLKFHQCE